MNILILTEGGQNIGFGHVVRCLSLYRAFSARGHRVDLVINGDDSVSSVTEGVFFTRMDWLHGAGAILPEIFSSDLIIVDSYLADEGFLKLLDQHGRKLAFLDDFNRLEYPRGYVINWSLGAFQIGYRERESVTHLLGPRFTSLRDPFWNPPIKKLRDEVETVFISLGGDDSRNLTPVLLNFLNTNFPGLKKIVVIGAAFTNKEIVRFASDGRTQLLDAPDANGMLDAMLESDIAICSGGQILYELARAGLPAVVIAVADNQLHNVTAWEKTGFIEYAGFWSDSGLIEAVAASFGRLLDKKRRIEAITAGKNQIPVNGAETLVNFLT